MVVQVMCKRFLVAFGLCSLFLCALASASEYLSHQITESTLHLETDNGRVSVRPLSANSVEVFYQPEGVKQLPSFAVADVLHAPVFQLTETNESLTFGHNGFDVKVSKSPFKLAYYLDGKHLTEEEAGLFVTQTMRGFRFKLKDSEKVMGGGQRVLGMDRRGHRLPLYNRAHYGYGSHSTQMNFSLPAVISSDKYAILFDNSATGYLDIGASQADILQFEAIAGRTAYIVVAGNDLADVTRGVTTVTGTQPLPPRWALGNFASRFGYRTQHQTEDTVARFRALNIPLDAIVLDLFWFGPDIQGHMGNLDWDREAFPQPEKMIADFQAKGVNTVVITEPFVLTTSNQWQSAVEADAMSLNLAGEPRTFDFYFGNTGLVDMFHPPAQDWFMSFYQRLFEQGVRGWWGDLGEPEVHPSDTVHRLGDDLVMADEIHNAYGHEWGKIVYQTHRNLSKDTRPMILMRAGFLGSQRYGMFPWTGDVSRSWDGLKPQVELSMQMSLFGLAYTHSDLGGFAGGDKFDQELYVRWLQYGVFQPVYRPHAQEQIAPEPVFHDKETQDIIREFINLRYQLLPYNYSLAYENSLTGMPLMRPMIFEDTNLRWFEEKHQYMWGDAFLVRPVVNPGVVSVPVALPEGVWYDFWTNERHDGGKVADVKTDLRHLPLFVKAGAIVPMVDTLQTTQDYDSSELNLHVYAFSDNKGTNETRRSSFEMFDDNGNDPDSLSKEAYQRLTFSLSESATTMSLKAAVDGSFDTAPEQRSISYIIHGLDEAPGQVVLTDTAGEKILAENCTDISAESLAYCFDTSTQRLTVATVLGSAHALRIDNAGK